ncbi:MAG TPA: uL15 family ribosomal protein [Candidatus Paceibacterota bacterium]
MQIHNVKRKNKNKKSKIVGRGGKHAKTSGRGTKGQNARAGHKKRPEIRDFIKRIPKLRGRGKNINTSIQDINFIVSLTSLDKTFKSGDTVSPATLLQAGLIERASGILPKVKILAGTTDKKLNIEGCTISAGAKEALLKAGGSVK